MAGIAPQPREALGGVAAAQESAEFFLDVAEQAATAVLVLEVSEEGVQVLADEGLEKVGLPGPGAERRGG